MTLLCFGCTIMVVGCVPRYTERPWQECIYNGGSAYVLQGSETIKTATLFTVDGTFKKFSFPVKRTFHVLQAGEPAKELGAFVHKAHDCTHSAYQLFPEEQTVIAMDDYEERLQNLTLKKSFPVGGAYIGLFQNDQSRYCLVKNFRNGCFTMLDKLSGRSTPVSRATTNFIADTWQVDLFLSYDGRRLTRAQTDYRTKTITVSAWDIQREHILLPPHGICVASEVDEPKILCCSAEDDAVSLVIIDSNPFVTRHRRVLLKSLSPDSFAVRQSFAVELDGSRVEAFMDGHNRAVLLFNESENPFRPSGRWVLKRYDLMSGESLTTETVQAPARP